VVQELLNHESVHAAKEDKPDRDLSRSWKTWSETGEAGRTDRTPPLMPGGKAGKFAATSPGYRGEMMKKGIPTYYVACDFGAESGRVIVGELLKGKLSLTEVHRFVNTPVKEGGSLCWNVPQLYQELLTGLRKAAQRGDDIAGISCDSWGVDYMLFEGDGSLITPTYHYRDGRGEAGMKAVLQRVPWETVYAETGIQKMALNTLFQLGAENPKRLKRARHLLPVGDAFNYLLSGVARSEVSMASTTQLYNPVRRDWSELLTSSARVPMSILPPIVPSGTVLGPLKPELSAQTGVQGADVIASCSHDTAAAVAAVPVSSGDWAFLSSGTWSLMGVELPQPMINNTTRELNFTNEIGVGHSVRLLKNIVGLWIVQECRRYWADHQQEIDYEVLTHLASSAPAFASLINPADPRFVLPGDMPEKIAAYCRETGQLVPKKPGQVIRCVLESLALYYRRTLKSIERLTGRTIERLHIVGGGAKNNLLNHFTANALQLPVLVGPTEATSAGNILVQAMALGHIQSLAEARELMRESTSLEVIRPQPVSWEAAVERLEALFRV
jgi:rhamnulokinase